MTRDPDGVGVRLDGCSFLVKTTLSERSEIALRLAQRISASLDNDRSLSNNDIDKLLSSVFEKKKVLYR